ncbi:MAG: ATP synthase subunit C [Candidatus Korarchaeota archaeon]|nr:ATP synthase subunit C [Candidatus Korarchaeota archaeon]
MTGRSRRSKVLAAVVFSLPILLLPASVAFAGQVTEEAEAGAPTNLGYFAAAAAVIGSTFAAAIALYGVAVGGSALLAERPDMFTAVIVLGGLSEGVAIYGFLIGYLILGKL